MAEKAAVYCRLSEEDKNKLNPFEDSLSIQNQKSMLTAYAKEKGWEIYGIYSDDDYTGADRNRPQFNRLLKDAEQHKFNIILCKTQSRFTRELELVEKYIHGLFAEWGIRFVSVVDNGDTENKGNKKSRQINGLVNEWYLEDMSENIKSVLDSRRQSGFHIGSFALYGYIKDKEHKGKLLIDEEAAEVVRTVFRLYSEGMGKTAIARYLNEKSIPSPAEYKRQKGLSYKQPLSKSGKLWKYDTITKMLKNEMYIGNMVQGKYGSISYKTKLNKPRPQSKWFRVENTHQAIIHKELWSKVSSMLSLRSKPSKSGKIGIFSGKAYCAYCGYHLCSTKSGGRRYLCCPNRYVSKNGCIGGFISETRLEQLVLDELLKINSLYLDKSLLEKRIGEQRVEKSHSQLPAEKAACQKGIADFSKALASLYMDRARGIVDEESFSEVLTRLNTQKENMQRRLEEIEKAEQNEEKPLNPQQLVEKYTQPNCFTHTMADIFIERIEVGRRIKGTRNVPVTIHWSF
ncbi:MAG: recombinase family protein [Ruminiclostridium sp.]